MRELLIGQRIKQFRKKKDLTQEEMAGHLNISFQTISKWERGESYPDITMLPALANYFEVTIDELIGMDEINSSEKIENLVRQWEINREKGKHWENIQLMKNALKMYPNDPLLLVQLSASLERMDGSETEKRKYLKQSIEIQERILQTAPDSEIRGSVLFNIAISYKNYGDYEKAIEYAKKLPNFYKTRESALLYIIEDSEEKRKIAELAVKELSEILSYCKNYLEDKEWREENFVVNQE